MNRAENIMETKKMSTLILQISIPMMLSLLISSLYGIVDSIFVAHINEEALTALSLSSPIQILISALGGGIAVGLNSAISKALGEKDKQGVEKTATASIWLAIGAYILIAVTCILFIRPYFLWQSRGNEIIARYGQQYLGICMLLSFGQMTQWVFDRFLISTGKSSLFLISLTVASLTNIVLDPIFIFGYFGLPAMGTAGAGLATVIGQIAGGIAGIIINLKFNKEISIRFTAKPEWDYCKKILKIGIPSALMQSLVAVMGVFINTILIVFSETAVAVFGICARIQNLVIIGMHGINLGLIPIVAYNYGANKAERIKEAVKWALGYSFLIMGVLTIILELLPGYIFYMFDASENLLAAGVPALRILAISYLISAISTILSSYFQALGKAMNSLALTLVRQVILVAVFTNIFASIGNLELIWSAYIIAEVLTIPLALFLYKRTNKEIFSEIFLKSSLEETV